MSVWRLGWTCLFVIGCGAAGDDVVDTDTELAETDTEGVDTELPDTDTDTDPGIVDTDPPLGTPLDAAAERSIALALEQVLGGLGDFDNDPVELAWTTMRDRRVADCNLYVAGEVSRLEGTCASPTGTRTIGQLERTLSDVLDIGDLDDDLRTQAGAFARGRVSQGWATEVPEGRRLSFFGMFFVSDDDGLVARINGTFDHTLVDVGPLSIRHLFLGGPVEVRDAALASWVARGLVPQDLDLLGFRDADGAMLKVSGAVGGWTGSFDAVTIADGVLWAGAPCASEPAGTWSVRRRADARWFDVVFDPEVSCDGCGQIRSGGAVVGTACVSTPALDADWVVGR